MPKNEKALRFQIALPPDLAALFLGECEREDRDMASMARYIIRMHYEQLEQEKAFEEFRRLQISKSGQTPHFEDVLPDLHKDGDGQKLLP